MTEKAQASQQRPGCRNSEKSRTLDESGNGPSKVLMRVGQRPFYGDLFEHEFQPRPPRLSRPGCTGVSLSPLYYWFGNEHLAHALCSEDHDNGDGNRSRLNTWYALYASVMHTSAESSMIRNRKGPDQRCKLQWGRVWNYVAHARIDSHSF